MNSTETKKDKKQKITDKAIYRAAIMVLPDKMHFILAESVNGIFSIKTARTASLPEDFYSRPDSMDIRGAIADEIRVFASEIHPSYAVINIVIPDTVVELTYFMSDNTAGKADSREYLRLKSAEKLKISPELMFFWSNENRDKTSGIKAAAFAADGIYGKVINESLYEAGLAANCIAPGFGYLHDLFHEKMENTDCGVFIMEADYWAFVLCGKSGLPVFMISRFHDTGLAPEKKTMIAAAEIERRLRAYTVSNKGINMERIYMAASADTKNTAHEAIKARFNCEFVQLETAGGPAAGQYPTVLLAAAGLI